jgi:hypothetical protein
MLKRLLPALLLAPLAIGCLGEDESEEARAPGSSDLALSWSGVTESDRGCVGGNIWLFLEDRGDETFTGKVYFESFQQERFRSTSSLEGALVDGKLVVKELPPEEADTLPEGWRWCAGDYTLTTAPEMGGTRLSGSWESGECACGGQTEINAHD